MLVLVLLLMVWLGELEAFRLEDLDVAGMDSD